MGTIAKSREIFENVTKNMTNDKKSTRPIVFKITPDGVLLYKHNALRVMCMNKRGAAEQWNSRQRRKIIEFHAQTVHQREFFMKLSQIDVSWKSVGAP